MNCPQKEFCLKGFIPHSHMEEGHLNRHLLTCRQTKYMQRWTHACKYTQRRTFSPGNVLVFSPPLLPCTSLRRLVEALLKSRLFHRGLWSAVCVFRAPYSYSGCDSWPVESDGDDRRETPRPLLRHEERPSLGFTANFNTNGLHAALCRMPFKEESRRKWLYLHYLTLSLSTF